MYQYDLSRSLPSAEELPEADETPVDNELQELITGLLKAILLMLWGDRMDWFFGIDMGVYYNPDEPPIVPDAFLSLGVERVYDEELRPSYALWDEQVIPCFVLEVVSPTYRMEYSEKLADYESMGVLYYAIYSSRRLRKPRLEVHKLVNGKYELQEGNPVWMPEIGLGIGYERGNYSGVSREWLYWYDEEENRYLTVQEQVKQEAQRAEIAQQQAQIATQRAEQEAQRAEQEAQRAEQEAQRAEQESQRAEKLAEKLRELGIDLNSLD